MFFRAESDCPGEDEDDHRADGGGEVGVDARDADFGKECGGGGEECGEERRNQVMAQDA